MKRTSALPGPQDYAANYVTIATRVVAKLLAQLDTVPVTLVAVVGGGSYLLGCDAVLGEGKDQELSNAGKLLTRAVVSEFWVSRIEAGYSPGWTVATNCPALSPHTSRSPLA